MILVHGPYQFTNPTGIAFDPYGFMYVLDTGNSRVQKWFPGAAYGTTVIATSMSTPYGIQFDNQGNLVITDTLNYRIISFCYALPYVSISHTVQFFSFGLFLLAASTTTTTAPPSKLNKEYYRSVLK